MSVSLNERLAVCSWSLRPESPYDLGEKLGQTGVMRTQLALVPMLESPSLWGDAPTQLADAGIAVVSGMFGTLGEDYSTLESIRMTGGVVLDELWDQNFDRAIQIADLAGSLGLTTVSFHAGFIPHERQDPDFAKLADRVRQIAQRFDAHDVALLLETGQESADSLLAFLHAVEQPNLGVNFDPANMILYGMGDPIASLRTLMPHVRQVHLKDAQPADAPGTWGREVPVGLGAVDWSAFVAVLQDAGYEGDLVIEREGGEQRVADIKAAAETILALA
jgi:sugar phosphate isomerase/epimerase